MIQEVLEVYPGAAREDRAKHLAANDPELAQSKKCIISNRKSLPGVMTIRGCAYAGSKGVVWGPIKDMIHISHGPVGCGNTPAPAAQLLHRHDGREHVRDDELHVRLPGEGHRLRRRQEAGGAARRGRDLLSAEQGDVGAVGVPDRPDRRRHRGGVEEKSKEHRQTNHPGSAARGFAGSRNRSGTTSPTIPFATMCLSMGSRTARPSWQPSPYDVSIIGDYNIGGDAWASRTLLEEMGLRVVAQWSGDGTIAELENTPKVKLNLLHCYRSMNYISRHMEEKYGIPWVEYNFFGPTRIAESLRAIATHFDDVVQEGAERVIEKYRPQFEAVIEKYKPRLKGKRVMLFVGGLRPRHVIGAYEDLGMEVVGTGYEFGHNDDYDRTLKEMGSATLLYDDVTGYEFEEFVKRIKPDLVGSGIKEKYIFQKMGVPFRQMHSWDYSGPYHGYDGFAIFARDMDMTVNNPCWSNIRPPWKS